jgi:hypothetical protein
MKMILTALLLLLGSFAAVGQTQPQLRIPMKLENLPQSVTTTMAGLVSLALRG